MKWDFHTQVTNWKKMVNSIEERFWSKAKKVKGGCWEWQRSRNQQGYGMFWFKNKWMRANRVAWELIYGSIPLNMQVCHSCDNPGCVNPNHLFLGSQHDNMRDCVRKGRWGKGYAQGITTKELCGRYKISRSTVLGIVRGEVWKDVGGKRSIRNYKHKLTVGEVTEIRRRYSVEKISHRELAKAYGVRHCTIGAILRGKNWKHLLACSEKSNK